MVLVSQTHLTGLTQVHPLSWQQSSKLKLIQAHLVLFLSSYLCLIRCEKKLLTAVSMFMWQLICDRSEDSKVTIRQQRKYD